MHLYKKYNLSISRFQFYLKVKLDHSEFSNLLKYILFIQAIKDHMLL